MELNINNLIKVLGLLDETIIVFSEEGEYKQVLSVGSGNACGDYDSLIGKNLAEVLDQTTAGHFIAKIQECLLKQETADYEYKVAGMLNVSEKTTASSYKAKLIPLTEAGEGLVAWVAYDISDFKMMEDSFKDTAVEDPVTGIFNRRFFFKELNNFFQRFQRGSNAYSIIMIELDHSDTFRDTYGLEVTEGVLTNFVGLIKQTLRASDLFATTGDEEFIILLPDTPSNGAAHMAERVRCAVESSIIEIDGEQLSVTASFGCSEVAQDDSSYDNVLNRAEIALYQAKHNEGNCVKRLNYENWKK